LYRKTNTQLLIINPSFQSAGRPSPMPGEKLSMLLAEESKGKLIKISHSHHDAGEAYTAPTKGEIRQILTGIETLLGSKVSSDMTRMQV